MTTKECTKFSLAIIVIFLTGLGSGLLISTIKDDVVKVKQGGTVSVQHSYGKRAHLSHDIIVELSRLNSEMRDAEEIATGLRAMLFSDNGGELQVSDCPDILRVLTMLKEGEGQVDYSQFFHRLERHEDRFGKVVFRYPK